MKVYNSKYIDYFNEMELAKQLEKEQNKKLKEVVK
jgi:hypothetical protein